MADRRELLRQFVSYGVVGVVGVALNAGFFWLLLRAHVWLWVAVTLAFFGSTAVQFYLNRHFSFRVYDRQFQRQMLSYGIGVVNWLLQLLIVEVGTHVVHLEPFAAWAISVPVNAIVGFAGNRYIAFGR